MRCMYFLTADVAPLENALRSTLYLGDSTPLDKVFLDTARKDFFKVYDKLRRLQSTFELGKPDVNALSKAVQPKTTAPASAPDNRIAFSLTQTQQASTYESSMDKCADLITG